jgi:fructosamine-3-kinase
VKLDAADHPFKAEADDLLRLAAASDLRVPHPLATGHIGGYGYLVLEWIDLSDRGDWNAAGAGLAALHGRCVHRYGADADNALGATRQRNRWMDDWAAFWREQRLKPQLDLATRNGLHALATRGEAACAASDALLNAHRPDAAMLHGDLWRGNLAFDERGRPVIFDPAHYHGDPDTDLSMARLFGGFPAAFFRAYAQVRPISTQGTARERLYQLYHVLNHANLFGGGYVNQAVLLIERLLQDAAG